MTLSPEMAPRTDHAYVVYEAAFGKLLPNAHAIADIGAGDSDFAAVLSGQGKDVVRVDAQYALQPPRGANYITADARDMSQIPDAQYDLTVSAFLLQHIEHGNGDVARTVAEMLRITKAEGYVALFPVWRPSKLQEELGRNFSDVARMGFLFDDHPLGTRTVAERSIERNNRQTLVIRKDVSLDDERTRALAGVIESSRALTKRRSLSDRARAAIISHTGETRRYVRDKSI